jgi:hypothetical protein
MRDFRPPGEQIRTALFWVITQRVAAISYRCFGKTCRFHLQEFLDPWNWDRYFIPKLLSEINTTRCVTSQKRAVFIYINIRSQISLVINSKFPYYHDATTPNKSAPPHYRGLTITLRRITLIRTPLGEWLARRADLYLTIHRASNPSKRAPVNPRLRQRAHLDRVHPKIVASNTCFYE